MEKRLCQNCKQNFVIASEDFDFYKKMDVPAPTFCPQCRLVRRFIWRNERSLYKRSCDLCKKSIISMYDDKVSFPVYCPTCFRSDKWDATTFAREYNFSKPFFTQWKELFNQVPRLSLYRHGECINCEYANMITSAKNVYLSSSVILGAEDVFYSNIVDNSKQVVDSYNVTESELIFEGLGSNKNYQCKYAYWSSNCIDCSFVFNCVNCQNCFACVNLRNKKYCIWNKEYSKDEYEKRIKEFNTGSYLFIEETKSKFHDFSLSFPRKYAFFINSVNSVGDELRDCKNLQFVFNASNSENIKYGYRCIQEKDAMDVCYNLAGNLVYEHALGASNGYNLKFIANGDVMLRDSEYVDFCQNSSNLFGCIGLKNKSYFLLNKQYEKDAYYEMVDKVKKHMSALPYQDSNGRIYKYGEFFPFDCSPFGYNETVANEFFPLSREEVQTFEYAYKEKSENNYIPTISASNLPDDIQSVSDSVLQDVIECEVSKKAYKITPFELSFYRRMNLPLPRLHPEERYRARFNLRNPLKLWHRTCMCKNTDHDHEGKCKNEFETSYAPERPEIVYCESCYQKEVV